ncbi:MAG: hypothetical protein CEE42_01115 [Promethearchaeota archaeon Loki_b31]|nr:MAG: hypothetical protein CEE42_01115 [Candidatus Lokiarchaeota archaeon Loki_b31]
MVLTNIINKNNKITDKKMSKIVIKKTLGVMIIKNILSRSTNLVIKIFFDRTFLKNEEKVNF